MTKRQQKDIIKGWIIQTLINDRTSTDEQLEGYFLINGLSPVAAKQIVKQRSRARLYPRLFKLDTRGLGL